MGAIACGGLALGLWVVSRVIQCDMIPYIGALICLGVLAELFVMVTARRAASCRRECRRCGRVMTVVETIPDPGDIKERGLIVGASGHCYKLLSKKYGAVLAVEVRMQWRACEACKRYYSTVKGLLVEIGAEKDAIDAQENTYRRNASTVARIKSAGLKSASTGAQSEAACGTQSLMAKSGQKNEH